MVFHVSEEGGIERFEPRPSEYCDEPVVWAIDEARLHNYLLPRECPRVSYYAGPDTTPEDRDRFLGSSSAVIAVESEWLDRLKSCRLYCYHFPAQEFQCFDACAGYFVSRQPVAPVQVEVIEDAFVSLLERGIEVRFLPNLWPLRDSVVSSTLQFSIIRMRNAKPRTS